MLKIHPGFTAIAILLGPATLINIYHNVSNYLSPQNQAVAATADASHELYLRCSDRPKLQRTVQCDEYVRYVDKCLATKIKCDPHLTQEILMRLELAPGAPRVPTIHKVSTPPLSNG